MHVEGSKCISKNKISILKDPNIFLGTKFAFWRIKMHSEEPKAPNCVSKNQNMHFEGCFLEMQFDPFGSWEGMLKGQNVYLDSWECILILKNA